MCRFISLVMCGFLIAGCAAYTGPGSDPWYAQRITELDEAYKKNEITRSEYFSLRNEIDALRTNYQRSSYDDYWPRTRFSYGYHYYH